MITLTREEAQQVLDALEEVRYADISASQNKAIETLRARLSQPESEPVAWTVGGLITDFSRDFSAYKTKTYTRPLYTSPPQREWQGLTDEEIREAWFTGEPYDKCFRILEAKLKEKNT
jgi:hypothetical protein